MIKPFLTTVAGYVVSQSWQILVVFALVAAICWGLRKASAHWRYWLWLIVLAKCLVPGLISVPLTVLPQKANSPEASPIAMPAPAVAAMAEWEMAVAPSEPAAAPVPPSQYNMATPSGIHPAKTIPTVDLSKVLELKVRDWLALAWLAGVALFLAYVSIGAWTTHRRLRRTRQMADPAIRTMAAALAERLGLKTIPTVYLVDGIAQPFVWGCLRGSVYLPEPFVDTGTREQQQAILTHELAHVARWDAAANLVQIVAQAVFFFHPLIWWTNRQIRREREKCCDEIVIAGLDADPKQYGQAIVNALVAEYEANQSIPSLAIAGRLQNIEERIQTILNPNRKFYRRPSRVAIATVACLMACAVSTALVLTTRSGADEAKAETTNAVPERTHPLPIVDTVKTIACSADGKLIAIANGNPTFPLSSDWRRSAEVLDAETKKTIVSLQITTNEEDTLLSNIKDLRHFEVEALSFSPDGNLVAVGTGIGQVKLFNTRTGELVRSLDDAQGKLTEKKTPQKLKSLRRAMGSVASLAFSPDGSLLAVCGDSFDEFAHDWAGRTSLLTGPGRLKVWDVKTGTLKQDLGKHCHVFAVAFSPDGNLLASAGRWKYYEGGTGVILWNPQDGRQIRVIARETNSRVNTVAFSPNGKLVVIGLDTLDTHNDTSTTTISLVRALTGMTEWEYTVPGWVKRAAFTPDGTSIAVLWGEQSIRFLETETGTMKHEIRSTDFSRGGWWDDFSIPAKGRKLAIGGVDRERKAMVELWDLDGLNAPANPAADTKDTLSPADAAKDTWQPGQVLDLPMLRATTPPVCCRVAWECR